MPVMPDAPPRQPVNPASCTLHTSPASPHQCRPTPTPTITDIIPEVSSISVTARIPDFWPEMPRLWFAQFESIMKPQKQGDDTKFNLVISKLNRDSIQQVGDLVLKPPDEQKYESLKQRLLSIYEESAERQFQKLISEIELGDQKPSQLLRKMSELARNANVADSTLHSLWLQRLPSSVRAVLTVSQDQRLDNLAPIADKIMENMKMHEVAQVTTSSADFTTNELISQINKLSLEIAEMKSSFNSRGRQRKPFYRSRSNSRSRQEHRGIYRDDFCYYHNRFKNHAYKCRPPCSWKSSQKKRPVASTEADVDVIFPSSRLCVIDRKSRYRFLIDTGANISVIPRSKKGSTTNEYKLYAANGSEIKTYGETTLILDVGLRRQYRWTFVVADVKQPILGADFLEKYNLLVDMRHKRLVDGVTGLLSPARIINSDSPTIKTINAEVPFADLLQKYPDITKPFCAKDTPKHDVVHQIITEGHPVVSKCRPLSAEKFRLVKKEIEHMLNMGICRPSKSSWASPIHVTKKKEGGIRLCGDYRKLNAITKPDRYPIPRLLDFTYLLPKKTIFSRIDLKRAYNQIPVEDVEKTAVITPFGLFEFPRMPFGLRNAGQTFMRFMNDIMRGLDYVFCFVDDILIASESEDQHREHVEEVFRRLSNQGITINTEKCLFGKSDIDFLGYRISQKGIAPMPDRVRVIDEYPLPKTIRDLKRFLGMLNFYRTSISHAAAYQDPLNKLMCGRSSKRDNSTIEWNEKTREAFNQCKNSLKEAIALTPPSPHVPLSIMTDASQTCVGAVLQQELNNEWKPIAFFSKALSEAQQAYSTYDRELLAIYMAICHFQNYCEGQEVIVYTDHKPLTYMFKQKQSVAKEKISPRRLRQLDYISQFTSDIRHLAGTDNAVADALSRISQIDCPSKIDWSEIATHQIADKELKNLLQNERLKWKQISLPCNKTLYCEVSTNAIRPYIPRIYRNEIFNTLHNITHPGIKSTRKLLVSNYFWPGINKDASMWAKQCLSCQKSKITRHNISPLMQFPESERFEHVHIDIVGPLPESNENRYIITFIDRFTRWPEAVPVPDVTAEVVAKNFYNVWISRFGCPLRITTDQGRQFESNLFTSLARLLGIKKLRTTSYHPQSNGLVERWHRTLKAAIIARGNSNEWSKELPTVLLGLRTAIREGCEVSPSQMVYGYNIKIPGIFFNTKKDNISSPEEFVQQLQRTMSNVKPIPYDQKCSNNRFIFKEMATCDYVFIRRDAVKKPLIAPYDGPYKVLEKHEKYFKIQLPNRTSVVSIDRLKPAFVIKNNELQNATSADKQQCANAAPDDSKTMHRVTKSGRNVKPVVRFGF